MKSSLTPKDRPRDGGMAMGPRLVLVAIFCCVGVLIRLQTMVIETNNAQTLLLERIAVDHPYLGKQSALNDFRESSRSRTTEGKRDRLAGYVRKELEEVESGRRSLDDAAMRDRVAFLRKRLGRVTGDATREGGDVDSKKANDSEAKGEYEAAEAAERRKDEAELVDAPRAKKGEKKTAGTAGGEKAVAGEGEPARAGDGRDARDGPDAGRGRTAAARPVDAPRANDKSAGTDRGERAVAKRGEPVRAADEEEGWDEPDAGRRRADAARPVAAPGAKEGEGKPARTAENEKSSVERNEPPHADDKRAEWNYRTLSGRIGELVRERRDLVAAGKSAERADARLESREGKRRAWDLSGGRVEFSVSDTIGELLQERKDRAGAGMPTDGVQEEITRLRKLQRPTDGRAKTEEGKKGKTRGTEKGKTRETEGGKGGKTRGDETRHRGEENKYESAPKKEDKNYRKLSRRVADLVRERKGLVDAGKSTDPIDSAIKGLERKRKEWDLSGVVEFTVSGAIEDLYQEGKDRDSSNMPTDGVKEEILRLKKIKARTK